MAREGHDLEWLSSDDDNDFQPLPAPSFGSLISSRLRVHVPAWAIPRNQAARWVIAGLTLFAAVGLVARIGAHNQLASPQAKPPIWLVNRPLTAPLSPFMAAECETNRCRALVAAQTDVRRMRAGFDKRFTVTAVRVRDPHGDLRGTQVMVTDSQGDNLTLEAVRVSEAPAHWDGESANLVEESPTSRWVVRTGSGVWLVESHSDVGLCDGDQQEYAVLYTAALVRVRASQLSL